MVLLVSVYIITQLPTATYAIYRLFLEEQEMRTCGSIYRFLTSTADTLTIVNSSVNFLIYYPSAATFRKSLHQVFRQLSQKSLLSRKSSNTSKTSYTSVNRTSLSLCWRTRSLDQLVEVAHKNCCWGTPHPPRSYRIKAPKWGVSADDPPTGPKLKEQLHTWIISLFRDMVAECNTPDQVLNWIEHSWIGVLYSIRIERNWDTYWLVI